MKVVTPTLIAEYMPPVLVDGAQTQGYAVTVLPSARVSIGESLFRGCISMTSCCLPKGLVCIGAHAFSRSGIASVEFNLPSALAVIEERAFYQCHRLTKVAIPASVAALRKQAFSDCHKLKTMTFGGGATLLTLGSGVFRGCENLHGKLVLPEGTVTVGHFAFEFCRNLTSVVIPDSVSDIGTGAFNACCRIQQITLPAGCTELPSQVFSHCRALKAITFPRGLKSVGAFAFRNCSSLTSVRLPRGLRTVGRGAFDWCINLDTAVVPDTLQEFGESAFPYGCSLVVSRRAAGTARRDMAVRPSRGGWLPDIKAHGYYHT